MEVGFTYRHEIHREDFGKRGDHGWEVDHQRCRKHGGGNDHDNLRAMHHGNNNWKRDRDADQFEYTDGGRHFRRD